MKKGEDAGGRRSHQLPADFFFNLIWAGMATVDNKLVICEKKKVTLVRMRLTYLYIISLFPHSYSHYACLRRRETDRGIEWLGLRDLRIRKQNRVLENSCKQDAFD